MLIVLLGKGTAFAQTGQPQPIPLKGHQAPVNTLVSSADGKFLARGSDDGTIVLWNIDELKPDNKWKPYDSFAGHPSPVHAVAFSKDAKLLASGHDDGAIGLWWKNGNKNPPEWQSDLSNEHRKAVRMVAFSKDGTFLASGDDEGYIMVWQVNNTNSPSVSSPPASWEAHTGSVSSLVFWPNGELLSADFGGTIKLWKNVGRKFTRHSNPPELQWDLRLESGVSSVAFSPAKNILASGGFDGTVTVWKVNNLEQPEELNRLNCHDRPIYSVAFSHDREKDEITTLAIGSAKKEIILWNWNVKGVSREAP